MRHRARRPLRAVLVVAIGAVLATASTAPAAAQTADDQWWHEQWRMDEVWQITDGTGVTVAVIDSGVEASVPDLAGAVLPGLDFADPDGDARTDYDDELDGHGTAVASLIVGNGTGTGIRGVAPGASILPIAQSLNRGVLETVEEYATTIRWAVDNDADVINMSLNVATGECSADLADAIRHAVDNDVIVVAGAGNVADGTTGVPASCPGVLTVGASDPWLEPWNHTHRSEHVDVSAPGYAIPAVGHNGQINIAPGTSRATALTSGAVALVRAHYPDATADEVLTRIIATARDIHEDGWDDATGYGLVRPYHALTEDVPPDADNPVFDALAGLAPSNPTTTTPATPAAAGDTGTQGSNTPVIAAAALLLLALVSTAFWLLRRRARAGTG